MGIESIQVVGGALEQKALHSKLDEKIYDVGKAHVWLKMLKDKMIPTRWNKPTKNGTKIRFKYPRTQEEFDSSLEELKRYIATVNEKHGIDISIR